MLKYPFFCELTGDRRWSIFVKYKLTHLYQFSRFDFEIFFCYLKSKYFGTTIFLKPFSSLSGLHIGLVKSILFYQALGEGREERERDPQ